MPLYQRIQRLERDRANSPDGRRRCHVCRDGALLGSVARFEGYPDWDQRGASQAGRCAACGRVALEPVFVRGINPDLL